MGKKTKKFLRQNNQLGDRLNTENQKIVTDIVCYLRGANISMYQQEVIRRDLLEMVLAGQDRGESVNEILGSDYEAFCDEIIASVPQLSGKIRFLHLLDTVFLALATLGAIHILLSSDTFALLATILNGRTPTPYISFSIGALVSFAAIAVVAIVIVEYIARTSLKSKGNQKTTLIKAILGGTAMAAIFLLCAWLGRNTAFTLHIIAACLIVAALYLCHRLLDAVLDD